MDEQNYISKEEFRIEQLEDEMKHMVEGSLFIRNMKKKIDRDIERFDEYVDKYLMGYPQHMIDEFKYKIGEQNAED